MADEPYTLSDLTRLADVTPRTVRYYVAQGLLPSPDAAGPNTRYGEGHLARLRLIKRLQLDHLPLAEIRLRLERMGDEDVIATVTALGGAEPPAPPDGTGTLSYVRSLMAQAGVRPSVPAPSALSVHKLTAPTLREALDGRRPYPAPAAPAAHMAAERLVSMDPPAIGAPAGDLAPPSAQASSPQSPPSRPVADRSTWERIAITSDVELHVRRPLDRVSIKRLEHLERIARELFEGS
jgi:DNA-binding transcriptional MerR regulator